MQNKDLVSVIVVNWNGKKWLEKCLPALANQTHINTEIILVDNNSTDESVSFVKKNFPNIKIIVNSKNEGFANANNIGFLAANGKFVLFLNNDTIVVKKLIETLLVKIKSDSSIGIIQPKILLMDDNQRLDSVGSYLTNTGFLYHYGVNKIDSDKYDKEIDIYSAKGACMFGRKEILSNVCLDGNLFDPDYFAYFEETDLCHRVWLSGKRVIFIPAPLVLHKMGGTSESMNNNFIQFHSFKNRINSYLKNLSARKLLAILPLHLLVVMAYAIYALLKFKLGLFSVIIKAILWNIKNIGSTLKKRSYIQTSIKKVEETEFWSIVNKNPRPSYYIHLFSSLKEYYD